MLYRGAMKPAETNQEIPVVHWADHAANDLIAKHPGKENFTCASGISPSGVVHIGNFREVITSDLVGRALQDRGKKVRFLYSWDDYDALRKVPANLPQPELIEANLRKALAQIPDPFGTEKSYAGHFEKRFEREIAQVGVFPEFIYQNEKYRSTTYAKGIKTAWTHQKEIAEILNRSRTERLPDSWTCISIFCKHCLRDTTELKGFVEPSTFQYRCKACKKDDQIDFEKEPGVKLLWRVDWPMRWAHENVDFEPGGKDHSSQGGSYETGAEIIRAIWKKEPPHYVQYDFVLAKGLGSKLSSSSGNLITLGEALEIYEPTVVRYLFASRKPNLDFSIAFDLDVMKAYDDFDRAERYAYGIEPGEEKKVNYERRIYELSLVERPTQKASGRLVQFPFRHLCNILQIHEGDFQKAEKAYASEIQTEADRQKFHSRAVRAWKWITTFAPVEFRFQLQTTPTHKSQFPVAMQDLIALLRQGEIAEEPLANATWELMKKHGLEGKTFFPDVYKILVNKPNGPKLAAFLLAIGRERAADILAKAL